MDSEGLLGSPPACSWESFTPEKRAFAAQPGGVFPLRDNDFSAGSYMIHVGAAGKDGLALPPAVWNTYGPYKLSGGHRYKAVIEDGSGTPLPIALRWEEDSADLLPYGEPTTCSSRVYVRNNVFGDTWYAICLERVEPAEIKGCNWESITPDPMAFAAQPGGVFPLQANDFLAGSYRIYVGPAGEDGLCIPPATWYAFGPYNLSGGHKYKAVIEDSATHLPIALRWEEESSDLLLYGDPAPGFSRVYVRNNVAGDTWYAICMPRQISGVIGSCDWTGTWSTNWGDMILEQDGISVAGNYTWDNGRIQGTVSGDKLIGTWSEAPSYSPSHDAGDIEFTLADDCKSFTGYWRYGREGSWSGGWTGTRQ